LEYSWNFPANAYESLLNSSVWYFDYLLLKAELSIIYSSKLFLQSNTSGPQICDWFESQYSITKSYKIICLVINGSKNKLIELKSSALKKVNTELTQHTHLGKVHPH
jgi:hypothetical protein